MWIFIFTGILGIDPPQIAREKCIQKLQRRVKVQVGRGERSGIADGESWESQTGREEPARSTHEKLLSRRSRGGGCSGEIARESG